MLAIVHSGLGKTRHRPGMFSRTLRGCDLPVNALMPHNFCLLCPKNTHDKVRKRALGMIKNWALEFESDPTLGIMNECYENLKSKRTFHSAISDPSEQLMLISGRLPVRATNGGSPA